MTSPVHEGIPLVPASWGELLDKISILEIKSARIVEAKAVANVRRELTMLSKCAEPIRSHDAFAEWTAALRNVNERLWDIEDRIRQKEHEQAFDDEFIALARAVYKTNDERAAIKRTINMATGSAIVEEKHYV
jgi:hypothetical protein